MSGFLTRVTSSQADARVAEIPDARTLRHYQTIGVLDKPKRYDGRRAIYGYRHLLQALGVKMLQGQGFSLAQIQQVLSDIGNTELERVVVEWLGDLQSVPSLPPPISSLDYVREHVEGKPLIAVEVGQGVSVILDPIRVQDPEVMLVAIRELVSAIEEEL